MREPSLVLQELDEAISRAFGEGGEPGPSYIDFPTDTLRGIVPKALQLEEHFSAKATRRHASRSGHVQKAVDLLWSARRVLVISGRGARGAGPELIPLLDRLGAVYLDTGESRGLVPDGHPSVVGAMRGAVMSDADVVLTVGRRLDFQLAYGSPAVFEHANFVRIGDAPSEMRDNRRGAVEILASSGRNAARRWSSTPATASPRSTGNGPRSCAADTRSVPKSCSRAWRRRRTAPTASCIRTGVVGRFRQAIGNDSVVITDGGDFLAFARVGLNAPLMLDPGPFGCIGIGVPFGIAASLAFPDKPVVVATGDGAFGFNAIEVDTAVRHKAPVLIVVANNGAWQIEVHDQTVTHGKVVGTRLQFADYAGMARAFGMHAERVETEEQLGPAIERALANRPGAARHGGHAGGDLVRREDRARLGARPAAARRLG